MVKEYYFKNKVLEQLDIHMKKSQQNKTENLMAWGISVP